MRSRVLLLIVGSILSCVGAAHAQTDRDKWLLWPNGAPGAKGEKPEDKPDVTIYSPHKASGMAIVVCPGGGYGGLAMDHEGKQIGEWLNQNAITALVLKYRHGGHGYRHPIPLGDAQRAIRLARSRAKDLAIDPNRVGILGFSAGGHLASTVSTHFDRGNKDAADPIDRESCRPDFAVLCYPVISFTQPCTHQGSKHNLLGKDADPKLVESLSNELQVTKDTPPTFLFHTNEDTGVPPENSILYYVALKKAKVPAELHIFEKGPHGVGLGKNIPGTGDWSNRCADWLNARNKSTVSK